MLTNVLYIERSRLQAEKEKEEANEIMKWTPEMNSRESLIHFVWQAIPDRKSGAYTSLDISRNAFDTITGKYDVSETAVDGEGLYQAAQSVLKAIYDASDTPDFLLGKDGRNGGALVLVVLTTQDGRQGHHCNWRLEPHRTDTSRVMQKT